MDKKALATKIRALREEKGLTQNALANIAGVSPTYIYQIEKAVKCPTVEYLEYICNALDVTLSQFFTGESDASDLTAKEKLMLLYFRKASDRKKQAVIDLLSE